MAIDTKPNSKLKTARVLLIIAAFCIEAAIGEALLRLFRAQERRKLAARADRVSKYSRAILQALGVRLREPHPWIELPPGLVVCNHLSYVDVFVLAATVPSLFVTSVEVRNQSWLGTVCRLSGCLFVERRSRSGLQSEIRAIDLALALGTSVVVFPEATSSGGEGVLPFKAALYQAAINAQVPVHHFCIRYEQPEIAYFGEIGFSEHFGRLLALPEITASLRYVGTLNEASAGISRYDIAQKSHQLIQNAYHSL